MRWICNALGFPETHLVEMFSLRKMLGSLVLGALALSVAAGSAGAAGADDVALGVALRGFDAGVAAADAQVDKGEDGTYRDEAITKALATISDLVKAKMEAESNGNGPAQAEAVLNALLEGESPSTLAPGQLKKSALAEAYGNLKAEQAKIKADKPDRPDRPDKPDTPNNDD
jgi:hypothetical protein